MSNQNSSPNGKSKCKLHLSLEQRKLLLELLRQSCNQAQIAESLGVAPTTVSRELLAHRKQVANRRKLNRCQFLQTCIVRDLCKNMACVSTCKRCRFNRNCTEICPKYEPQKCNRIQRFPYVCDGCPNARNCVLDFYRYDPITAHKEASQSWVNARRGINMTEEEFSSLDRILTEGTQKGQSVEHIVHANHLQVAPRTIRRYISLGITTVKKLDTPRGATYKPRKTEIPKEQQQIIRRNKLGRDLSAFFQYAQSGPLLFFTEMDTVEGTKRDGDKKRLLTLISVRTRLFYSVLLPDGTSHSVKVAIDNLYRKLGPEDFSFLFGILLTDNGTEFSDPDGIEYTNQGERRCRIFFCNPYASWEKGSIEVCHELFRRIVPKGSSLASLTPNMVNKINCHINSYHRESNGECAYDTFVNTFGERGLRILEALQISKIDPADVILTPRLLRD